MDKSRISIIKDYIDDSIKYVTNRTALMLYGVTFITRYSRFIYISSVPLLFPKWQPDPLPAPRRSPWGDVMFRILASSSSDWIPNRHPITASTVPIGRTWSPGPLGRKWSSLKSRGRIWSQGSHSSHYLTRSYNTKLQNLSSWNLYPWPLLKSIFISRYVSIASYIPLVIIF